MQTQFGNVICSVCVILKKQKLSKKLYKNVAWELVLGPFLFLKSPL